MESVLSTSLPITITARGGSASLQITLLSGAEQNPHIDFSNTALFLGSDPECDLVLSQDHFPPMYAFLLLESQSVILRHLGGGPTLFVDQEPVQRRRIESVVNVQAGPLALTLRVTPSESPYQNLEVNARSLLAAESGTQLIEQASRLLASIGSQPRQSPSPVESFEGTPVRTRFAHTPTATPDHLKLSVGLPTTGQLPPTWQHVCL